MIRYFLLFLSCVSVNFATFSQTSATVLYTYRTIGGYEHETKLFINDNQFFYLHRQPKGEQTTEQGYRIEYKQDHYDWFLNKTSGQIIEYREKETYPPLFASGSLDHKWDIHNETQIINGYLAQKATTKVLDKSMDYGDLIAWFVTDIPFSAGPERYFGLPGLIVKIEYSKWKSIYCTIKSIKYDTNEKILNPKKIGVQVSVAEIINPSLIDKKWLKEQKKLID